MSVAPASRSSLKSPLDTTRWALSLPASIVSLALARETGWVLTRTEQHWLYLLDHLGQRQGQLRGGAPLTCCAAADDGTSYATGSIHGDVWWLAPDLMARWQRSVPQRVAGLAIDPHGQYVVVSDGSGGVTLFTRFGHKRWSVSCPRPLVHLAFVPESPHIIGCADHGLILCLDFEGKIVWRDGIVAHIGGLGVSGDGSALTLACFSDGLYRYGLTQTRPQRISLPEPARLVCASYDGRVLLSANLSSRISILNRDGKPRGERVFDAPITAAALGPLGDRAYLGQTNGVIMHLQSSV